MKSKSEKEKNDADGAIERDGKKYYHLGRRFKNRGKKRNDLLSDARAGAPESEHFI